VAVAVTAIAQSVVVAEKWKVYDEEGSWCSDRWNRDNEYACEARELTIDADWETITVDGSMNGGIEVEGWKRDEIRIRAKIRAWSRDEDEARDILEEIEIKTSGEKIHASGPKLRGDRRGWAVSYELMVPRNSNLALETTNGGISITDVHGEIEFDATNGGISLTGLAGDVQGSTTNGGLTIELEGDRWNGKGLDVRTTNGGIEMRLPEGYSAELVTGTVNGSIHLGFPIMVEGTVGKRIKTSLGEGGAPIKATTTNGGVKIRRG